MDVALLDRARRGYEVALEADRSNVSYALSLGRLDLRAGQIAQAEGHLKNAVALAPNDAFVWTELARLAQLRREPEAKAAEYLKLSWLTGPYELSSLIARPKVALSYWDELSPDLRERTGADIRRMWDDKDLRWYLRPLYLSLSYEERARFLDAGFSDQAERRAFLRQVLWKLHLKKELQRYDRRNP